ncbi:regulation of nuclear pre-mRNA domain-containing protein 1B isoform X1 [Dendrobium catenatum]|uniref:regulation of nuclear pre-mRNA domain-containing protein 1B isoform X1 n=2 Tax=Dendrobium catenatum TaxID=906689 RepID=UPI0009F29ECF|nr:regulation of nuclear pre-mRNA domain-containing protein 1B isoform X1 [Dendrobium catenatum]XP_028548084.1 regulation of nuclear pre-mRNA domain-containing protein 1B isoform X1 [Dendrobium catenatum]
MDAAFSTQILTEKLSKLNNSQQSIESLSHWCINNRKKARQIVEIWEKLFNSSSKEQKVPFLYLANDILQNSRRKGSEFVNEFWKVLPGSLKGAHENGEENIKNSVMRLVDIWDERKVFGSRARGLKDDILGNKPPAPPLLSESNGKNPNPIKLVRKDAHSVRIKLAVGGMPERIVTAYQAVLDEHFDEDTALNKCKSAVCALENMEKEVNDVYVQGSQHGMSLMVELKEQEHVLKHCIQQLGQVEATRATLFAQLKEALQEQESKLDLIRSQLQVAQKEAEHAINMRQMLASIPTTIVPSASVNLASVPMAPQVETSLVTPPMLPSHNQQPITSSMNATTSVEDEHKKAAAAVAAKLAASTSSAQVLTSILSSLVAEEAASMNGSQSSGFITSSNPMLPPDKRPKLEKPMSITDMNSKFFGHITQQQQHQHQLPSLPLVLPQSSATSIQPIPHSTQPLQPFATQPPPLPSAPPPQSMQPQTYMQSSGVLMNSVPFGYNGSPLPPPSFPSHVSVGMTRPNAPTQPPPPATPPQPKQQHPQQQPPTGGFFPSGIGFYGQLPAAPPVPRQ